MAKFNYSFQKLLDLKENEREFAQLQMAEAIKQQDEAIKSNQKIHQKIAEVENEINQKQLAGVNIFELRMLEDYIHQLYDQLKSTERNLELMESKVIRTQGQLRTKVQEEKTWINLKDQKLIQFEEQQKLAEQNLFDEMATTQFYRRSTATH